MKSKDIYVIIIIGIISTVASLILSGFVIGGEDSRTETVKVIPVISSELNRPSQEYFNSDSINPTQLIRIGGEASPTPFGGQ
jgi:hypothetical protein